MKCPSCQFENPEGAKFCLECGKGMSITCSNCGKNLPSGAKFCLECGTKVDQEELPSTKKRGQSDDSLKQYIPQALLEKMQQAEQAGGMQNERRIVTMLFCDLQGSTAAAEQLDPEEWLEIMNGAFEYMIQPVYKYEGVIARIMGDAILAFFGAPIAHEDDPERAVLTGLEIIDNIDPYLEEVEKKWNFKVDVRVGINTGLVVVGEMGSDLRVEYSAAGDAINLASRMESTAEPGTLQISEYTYKLVEPLFEFEALGMLDVKGKSQPVKTYKVIRQKEEREILRGLKGLDSPLVGRDDEFDIMMERVNLMLAGKGQIVSLIAEAGLGKSRLVRELKDQLLASGRIRENNFLGEGDEERILWLTGVSLSYQTNSPFAPFKVLLTKYLDIEKITSNDDRYLKLKKVLSNNDLDSEYMPYIAQLLDIQPIGEEKDKVIYLDPPVMRSKIFEVCEKLFFKWCNTSPMVIVLDDIHWIDKSSFELIKKLISLVERDKILFVFMFRPRREDPSWQLHEYLIREYNYIYTPITLQPLNNVESRFLIFNILKIEGLSEQVRNLILDKSEGNPFFLEEVIRSMIDQNMIEQVGHQWREVKEIEQVDIPDTLAGVLTTRLDQLNESLKRTLQIASVIGREFDVTLLNRLTDDIEKLDQQLIELERREMIVRLPTNEYNDYSFKHPLTQESAYNSLLLKTRRELHSTIAHLLQEDNPENYNEIAHHYYEAKLYDHAFPFLVKSGKKAFQNYAIEEAIQYFKQAESLIEDTTDIIEIHDLYRGMGETYLFSGNAQDAITSYENLIQLAEKRDHLECKVNGLNQLGFTRLMGLGQFDTALEALSSAEQLAVEGNYDFGIAENYMIMCNVETASAQFESVEAHLLEVAEIGERLDEQTTQLYGRSHVTNTYFYTCRFDDAISYGMETAKLANEFDNKAFLAELYTFAMPMSYFMKGDLDEAFNLASHGYKISLQINIPVRITFGATVLAEIHIYRGYYEEAQSYAKIGSEMARDLPIPAFRSLPLACELFILIQLGIDEQEIIQLRTEMETILDNPMGSFLKSKYYTILGFYFLKVGDPDSANEYFDKLVNEPGTLMIVYEPQAHLGYSLIALMQNRLDDAIKHYETAEGLITVSKMKIFKPGMLRVKANLLAADNKLSEAIATVKEAIQIADEMNGLPDLIELNQYLSSLAEQVGDEELQKQAQESFNRNKKLVVDRFIDDELKQSFLKSLET